ncbi:hypothetical protein CYLTODRAFT_174328 [Cylindrobasidium torrendii FP15055 ss-10]|uniref:DUF6699 domain-containing protein n=1 Tax=Cylindrobasidium torrendii FP15055 ss-10 TaxID=1314674 RepID=A0A0D7AWW4_9AGAR|nr:hypothetical protein CYLTODRAFT_174328 [Cylindrobasidium torrendii FP15055 ss-10]
MTVGQVCILHVVVVRAVWMRARNTGKRHSGDYDNLMEATIFGRLDSRQCRMEYMKSLLQGRRQWRYEPREHGRTDLHITPLTSLFNMPSKRVRFATSSLAYPAPSPTKSDVYLSSVPHTGSHSNRRHSLNVPSSGTHHESHHHRSRSSSFSESAPALHAALVVAKPRALNFDVAYHYSYLSTPYPAFSSRPGLLSEPACSPPIARAIITCARISWRIEVRPSFNGHYITLHDILRTIYYDLRRNVSSAEWNALDKPTMTRVAKAYDARHKRIASRTEAEAERKGGVRRVDYLMGHTNFTGLARVDSRSDRFEMYVS